MKIFFSNQIFLLKHTLLHIETFTKTITLMRKTTLTILLVAAVAAAWAQKPDKKTVKWQRGGDGL